MNNFQPGAQIIFANSEFTGVTSFYCDDNKIAELRYDKPLSARAFFDFQEKRFELKVAKGKNFFKRRALQIYLAGHFLAEMKTNWLGNKGELVTIWKHLFSFGLSEEKKFILKLDSENIIIFSISKKNKKGERIITLNNPMLELDELLTLISAICLYIIRLDNSQQTASITPPISLL